MALLCVLALPVIGSLQAMLNEKEAKPVRVGYGCATGPRPMIHSRSPAEKEIEFFDEMGHHLPKGRGPDASIPRRNASRRLLNGYGSVEKHGSADF
jgi:hypothetical protein